MSNKVTKFLYWAFILPPVFKAIKSVIKYAYEAYMNTLMEISEEKMVESFNDSWKEKKK